VSKLEALVSKQNDRISELQQVVTSVQRDCRRTVSVLQYNILASYLGLNTQPWFLYGADISGEERERIFARYYERDSSGRQKYSWPETAEGILSPMQIRSVNEQNSYFCWDQRKGKLVEEIRDLDMDVLSLVELDHHPFFAQCLGDVWDSVFHKRPRAASLDGCGVFWRRSKFAFISSQGIDFVDGNDAKGHAQRDRSCLMVLLRWRACSTPLIVVSTHLAKDPDKRAQTAIRVRQVSQIMEALTDFSESSGAVDAPVILLGDLNARHFGEIRGIARTVWQIKGSPIHKFLWNASDVPTGPTSVTKARQCRIDVVQFIPTLLEVVEVLPVPKLPEGEVIPNAKHPSDHFPVCVRFRMKDTYQQNREIARSWLECVAGREKLHPLTESELITAFEFFDRDRSSLIHRHDLEEACIDLQGNYSVDVQRMLLECFPSHQINYENFVRAYEARLSAERMRCIGDLEYAFQFFAKDQDASRIHVETLEAAFREITPVSFSDVEVKEMIGRIKRTESPYVDLHGFCEVVALANFPHKARRTSRLIEDPSVVKQRMRTKELAKRLNNLNETIFSGSVSDATTSIGPVCHSYVTLTPRMSDTDEDSNTTNDHLPGFIGRVTIA